MAGVPYLHFFSSFRKWYETCIATSDSFALLTTLQGDRNMAELHIRSSNDIFKATLGHDDPRVASTQASCEASMLLSKVRGDGNVPRTFKRRDRPNSRYRCGIRVPLSNPYGLE